MFDIAWSELMVIGVLALLVIGPKELPGLLRSVGQWVARARGVARDFQRAMDDAARDADMPDVGKIRRDFAQMGRVDFTEQARRSAMATQSSAAARLTGAPAPVPTPPVAPIVAAPMPPPMQPAAPDPGPPPAAPPA